MYTLYTLYREDINTRTFIQSSRPVTLDMHSVAKGTRAVHTGGRHRMRRSKTCVQKTQTNPVSIKIDIFKELHNLETGGWVREEAGPLPSRRRWS
jgi:hypothetical protein